MAHVDRIEVFIIYLPPIITLYLKDNNQGKSDMEVIYNQTREWAIRRNLQKPEYSGGTHRSHHRRHHHRKGKPILKLKAPTSSTTKDESEEEMDKIEIS
jgi:hypothetical protein